MPDLRVSVNLYDFTQPSWSKRLKFFHRKNFFFVFLGRSCPYIVRAAITEIESRGMADVGLYRVSAARSDIIMLKEYFDTNHPDLNRKLQECDIHTSK